MKNNQRGFIVPLLVAIIALMAIGGAIYVYENNKTQAPVTADTITSPSDQTFPQPDSSASPSSNVVQNVQATTSSNVASSTIVNTPVANTTPQNPPISTSWKTFTDTTFGFNFQYPAVWRQFGGETKAIGNLQTGAIGSVEVDLTDRPVGNEDDNYPVTSVSIQYALPPGGADAYNYALADCKSKTGNCSSGYTTINVAGTTGIEFSSIFTTNGKGQTIPPLRSIVAYFLNPAKNGTIEVQMSTPANANESAETKLFNQLLSTFKVNSTSVTSGADIFPNYVTNSTSYPWAIKPSSAAYSCIPDQNTTQTVINGTTYCIHSSTDNTTNPTVTYTYTTQAQFPYQSYATQAITFTIVYSNCNTYADPNASNGGTQYNECLTNQSTFKSNLNRLVDSLM